MSYGLLAGLGGCASVPETPPGVGSALIEGLGFQHKVFWHGDLAAPRVHVYLEGDGRPWIGRTQIAADPGPFSPLALRLMARDPNPAILIGRPCYHGLARSPGCTPWLWTHGRYSEQVVASLAQAIQQALPPQPGRELILIGHSGGGVLAVLLAYRLPEVSTVVTLAANLDVAAWAKHRGYSPLSGSLDPSNQPPLPPTIRQLHLIAEQDQEVPASTLARYLVHYPQAHIQMIAGTDHRRGWIERWPEILQALGL
ncbi:alpha/beta hydrolase [Caldichromatium japonicum]|uniref:Alpha/beta hydrolase n=1 Tax=Caldichromatium japonicum TaxID=2699430 RepID=A0A6G7VD55_9GAMM|nr:alpha/beta hydrolase [Caldichromatium japonicum]QIK37806.1 alpha/beta hydrolase [Caldichromatium japonicum]